MIELAQKRPEWLKVRAPGGKNYVELQTLMRDLDLHTVCSARSRMSICSSL